jgi:hypothetical protein
MREVHVQDGNGKPIYNRLRVGSDGILRFESTGHLSELPAGAVLVDGWVPLDEWYQLMAESAERNGLACYIGPAHPAYKHLRAA